MKKEDQEKKGFWAKWRGKIIATIITVAVPAVPYAMLWVHDAYADGRYVGQEDFQRSTQSADVQRIMDKIESYDEKVELANQEVLLTDDPKEKERLKARSEFFFNRRETQKTKLKAVQKTPKDG